MMDDLSISFPTDADAQRALIEAGFSIGATQRSDPRGIIFGDFKIEKWRNLSTRDKAILHGTFNRHGSPGSPTTVNLRHGGAPNAALRKIDEAAASLSGASQGDTPAGPASIGDAGI